MDPIILTLDYLMALNVTQKDLQWQETSQLLEHKLLKRVIRKPWVLGGASR